MNRSVSRFERPSSPLQMRALLRKARRTLWWALALALGVHVSLTRIAGFEAEQKAAKPLTTQFVKREPRLTKPLELKKRPQPKRRRVQREMVAVRARTARDQAARGVQPAEALRGLARPRVEMARGLGAVQTAMEPQAVAQAVEGAMQSEDAVDMSLEMMDVGALDTGRYHAMVIQDPTDKRNIKGFFRLKYAYSESQNVDWFVNNDWRVQHALKSMVEAISQYTNINASYEGKIPFTSREMMKTPWVFFFIMYPFVFSNEEASCLGGYLVSGGFALCDAYAPVEFYRGHHEKRLPIGLTCAHHNFELALATQRLEYGRVWTFDILPNDHPLFHCYFDFDGCPASWYDTEMNLSGKLEGITVDGRLLVAICQKALVHIWGDPLNPQMREERMVQFGINTIIFALTQEGSITHRVVDEVR